MRGRAACLPGCLAACLPARLHGFTVKQHPGGLAREMDCVHVKEAWPEAQGAILNLGSQ